jgi:signal transduction histidine kinase
MVAQADGARFMIETDPRRARDAMHVIAHTGREALGEMRHLLGVLRPDDARRETAPQPGLEQVDDLVARLRDAGLHVEMHTEGTPRPVPAGTGLAAYRTIQEALTNTFKHAGPTAAANVQLQYVDDRIVIRVDDDGPAHSEGSRPPSEAGHGLVGMRERAEMYGGLLSAGPRENGGYRVDAQFPIGAAS